MSPTVKTSISLPETLANRLRSEDYPRGFVTDVCSRALRRAMRFDEDTLEQMLDENDQTPTTIGLGDDNGRKLLNGYPVARDSQGGHFGLWLFRAEPSAKLVVTDGNGWVLGTYGDFEDFVRNGPGSINLETQAAMTLGEEYSVEHSDF